MLPLHYSDSCIFLELFSKGKGNKSQLARAYFYNVNKKYNAMISNLVLGEIYKELSKIGDDMEKITAFHRINNTLEKLEITSPQFEDYNLALQFKKINYKLEPADALHLAMAMNNRAQVFATLGEKELASNEVVKRFCKERGLKIEVIGE